MLRITQWIQTAASVTLTCQALAFRQNVWRVSVARKYRSDDTARHMFGCGWAALCPSVSSAVSETSRRRSYTLPVLSSSR
jgi:hypothetical protein